QQTGAQVQVSFECSTQASRQLLDRIGASFSRSLAQRLGREVAVQVGSVDGTDDGFFDIVAGPDEVNT
ncbi:MAG: hypothetical protein Q8N17_15550, partial [Burkholderiaceae bacterium]|nr:hypothetical protein [Burkholderiaceae bacterium]